MAETTTDDRGARSLAVIVTQLDQGALNAEASEKLAKLTRVLSEHANTFGKAKGKLTLVLDLQAEDDGTVAINGEIKVSAPKTRHARTVFWVGNNDELLQENPRQQKLGLREVPGGKAARAVDGEEAKEARGV